MIKRISTQWPLMMMVIMMILPDSVVFALSPILSSAVVPIPWHVSLLWSSEWRDSVKINSIKWWGKKLENSFMSSDLLGCFSRHSFFRKKKTRCARFETRHECWSFFYVNMKLEEYNGFCTHGDITSIFLFYKRL